MGIWNRISEVATNIASNDTLGAFVDKISTTIDDLKEGRRQFAFTTAMIALAAKMAKADGVVTSDEVEAFQQLFAIPEEHRSSVARIFNLAKGDVAGFEAYANQIAHMHENETAILEDIVDGLFHIAKADGVIHQAELQYLGEVARIFGLDAKTFERLTLRHIVSGNADPYKILDVDRSLDNAALKSHYRKLVIENHPDRLMARGVPEEFIKIANDKLASINEAYDRISLERGIK
ncbi:MAG: molecular chaperone DjlA [Hyphomicrobiales bacterium]|nr:MAG: molecular chaperone DjlA [Hyphomicrobiales bacterium]